MHRKNANQFECVLEVILHKNEYDRTIDEWPILKFFVNFLYYSSCSLFGHESNSNTVTQTTDNGHSEKPKMAEGKTIELNSGVDIGIIRQIWRDEMCDTWIFIQWNGMRFITLISVILSQSFRHSKHLRSSPIKWHDKIVCDLRSNLRSAINISRMRYRSPNKTLYTMFASRFQPSSDSQRFWFFSI